jgi:hypothetical protein
MLSTQGDDVTTADTEIKKESECKARRGADRIVILEPASFLWSPSMDAIGGVVDPANLSSRV